MRLSSLVWISPLAARALEVVTMLGSGQPICRPHLTIASLVDVLGNEPLVPAKQQDGPTILWHARGTSQSFVVDVVLLGTSSATSCHMVLLLTLTPLYVGLGATVWFNRGSLTRKALVLLPLSWRDIFNRCSLVQICLTLDTLPLPFLTVLIPLMKPAVQFRPVPYAMLC